MLLFSLLFNVHDYESLWYRKEKIEIPAGTHRNPGLIITCKESHSESWVLFSYILLLYVSPGFLLISFFLLKLELQFGIVLENLSSEEILFKLIKL